MIFLIIQTNTYWIVEALLLAQMDFYKTGAYHA